MQTKRDSHQNLPKKYRFIERVLFPRTRLKTNKLTEQLNGKVVLITGASYGIGERVSVLLADTGVHLILVGRTKEKLISVQHSITEKGGSAEIFTADLRNDDEIQSLIEYLTTLPRLDVFINNAGKSIRRPIVESLDRYHDFSRTMAINYEAPVKLMLALIPQLQENKGHVVNVSAINVLMAPAPFWAAYQASKTAFDQWFRSAIPELERLNISTTSVYLPLVRTRMIAPTKSYDKMPAMNPDHVARIIGKCLVKKKRVHKPWWSFFGELGSVLFRKTWTRMARNRIKSQN